MAKIFITGSADGLGEFSARALVALGHHVVLHARNNSRGEEALKKVPGVKGIVIGDLSKINEIKLLAEGVNKLGTFDAVIHNAGLFNGSPKDVFTVNTLAPYILTCLINPPKRLVYISSDMHQGGRPKLEKFKIDVGSINYSDTKLHVLMLCKTIARRWPDVYANALSPGWVPTKMGGRGAPDNLQKGYETQVWLSVSVDDSAKVSGRYFFHQQEVAYNQFADEIELQEKFLDVCREITGLSLSNA